MGRLSTQAWATCSRISKFHGLELSSSVHPVHRAERKTLRISYTYKTSLDPAASQGKAKEDLRCVISGLPVRPI